MSATPLAKRIVPYGLSEVYSVPDPQVDIVFVHGLNGHPHHTWATHKPDVFWPGELLPQALEDQRCRVLTYGYDANVGTFTDGSSRDEIHNHAEHLASRLVANRSLKKALERPIIFVCHSLGGLVVKRCLIQCKNVRHAHTERLRSIYVSTYGVLFLGTPHNGSDLAKWGTLLQSICAAVLPKKFFDSSPQLIEALKANNVTLQNINRLFIEIVGRFHVYFFHESKPTDFKGTRRIVVDEDSAAPVIEGVERMGIERDHSHMCKFEDESAPGYDVVAEAIQRYATNAPQLISSRWNEERQIRDFERQGAAREMLGDSIFQMSDGRASERSDPRSQPESLDNSIQAIKTTENSPGVPLLIAPLGFRRNTLFLGFQIEIGQLQRKLDNRKRRALGSCAVLVWGATGSGKSHLVRQFVWLHRDDYPGGTFWVDAKSEESLCRGFWDIGQAAALLGLTEIPGRELDMAYKFIDAVRTWLESRKHWLLVFDGLTFDSDEELQDFVKFIPDCQTGSVIFTSIDKTLARRQRLLDPSAVKVHPLSTEDARIFLYQSLHIGEPTAAQAEKATELVKHYECLPLAIHAAAHALIAKGRALEQYSRGSTDRRLAQPYVEILQALLERGHVEAYNLIILLTFLNHNVPVALLNFGRKILADYGIEVRAMDQEGSSKARDMDNTIAVLIRYGLVERTLQAYQFNTSLSAEASFASTTPASGNTSPDVLRTSIEVDETSMAELSGRDSHRVDTSGDKGVPNAPQRPPDANSGCSSTKSTTCNIDILRVHTVVQGVLRDQLRLNNVSKEKYWWWLGVASRLLCQSYAIADEKIKASSRPALVRDYREYETQAARLWARYPKKPDNVSKPLKKARHELHNVLRAIKHEIESKSPGQSFDSLHHRVQLSIFERASSTSTDEPDTPTSNLTRASTWSIGEDSARTKSESPTNIRPVLPFETTQSEDEYWDAGGYESGNEDRSTSSNVTTRRSSKTDTIGLPQDHSPSEPLSPRDLNVPRRRSFIHSIFKGGRPVQPRTKNLGEWKPMPAPPSLSHTEVRGVPSQSTSRTSSSDERTTRPVSAGSEAELALAAVHRFSPPASRGGRVRSPSRPRSQDSTGEEVGRPPLTPRSPNLQSSPLALEFNPSGADPPPNFIATRSNRSRADSANADPAQTPTIDMCGPSSKALPPLPIEEGITITRRVPARVMSSASSPTDGLLDNNTPYYVDPGLPMMPPTPPVFYVDGSTPGGNMLYSLSPQNHLIPSGYTSAPMSRDTSRQSNTSNGTI